MLVSVCFISFRFLSTLSLRRSYAYRYSSLSPYLSPLLVSVALPRHSLHSSRAFLSSVVHFSRVSALLCPSLSFLLLRFLSFRVSPASSLFPSSPVVPCFLMLRIAGHSSPCAPPSALLLLGSLLPFPPLASSRPSSASLRSLAPLCPCCSFDTRSYMCVRGPLFVILRVSPCLHPLSLSSRPVFSSVSSFLLSAPARFLPVQCSGRDR